MKRLTIILIGLILLLNSLALAQYDKYGGWLNLKGMKTGFFHTQQIDGRWWLVSPEGNAFFMKGVGGFDRNTSPNDLKNLAKQLKGWNFNSIGGSATGQVMGIPYTITLNLAASQQANLWLQGIVLDYFSPEFRQAVERQAAELCPKYINDPLLIGYFTDNEVRWFPDIRSKETILETFLNKSVESPGYQKAVAFLKERGHTRDSITYNDKASFLEIAAAEYGRICRDAIRRHDMNHLILGSRFNEKAPIPLSRALAPYFDVFSFNSYEHRAPLYKLREIARITGKPTMITEFSFKAMDSENPNTIGAGDPVATQQDRADLYAAWVQDLATLPTCLGFDWFKYRDQPKEGAGTSSPGGWGGENSNYGLVKLDGTPWTVLVNRMKEVNGKLETLAAKSDNP